VPFDQALALQEQLRTALLQGEGPETLLLCEHDPVITLGRSARPEHLLVTEGELAARGIEVRRVSRGGSATYHGPGQLVGYPVFRLRRGIVAHMEAMAAAVVSVLGGLGIAASWRRDLPGVWVRGKEDDSQRNHETTEKICALGVHVRRRVAIHGFALNVASDAAASGAIVPCGLHGFGVTSVVERVGRAPAVADLAAATASAIARAFDLDMRSELSTSSTLQIGSRAL
jgi:lipoyl(octanoyl) transferase